MLRLDALVLRVKPLYPLLRGVELRTRVVSAMQLLCAVARPCR